MSKSIKDEAGLLQVVLMPDVYQQFRSILHQRLVILVAGKVERDGRATTFLAMQVWGGG